MNELATLLERFRRGPEVVAMVMTGAYGEELDWRSEPDRWSLREIAAHLADSELVGAFRIRTIAADENPDTPAYDESAWARTLGYERKKPSHSLELFRRIRAENYDLLKEFPEPVFERSGMHPQRGRVTLLEWLRVYAEHAEGHARQMQDVRNAFKQWKAQRKAGG
jgi:hypothetical protein